MNTVIIGIHGLRNKPPKELLSTWWVDSIKEGFRIIDLPRKPFQFEMAYWAHHMHPEPQDPSIDDTDSPCYLWEPYVKCTCFGPREPDDFGKKITGSFNQQILRLIAGKSGFMNIDTISDIILRRMFIELDVYYHKSLEDSSGNRRPARELICNELASLIRKHQGKNICVLAHSMGSIIAYDVLRCAVRDVPVHTFITIGSPLGFPVIMNKIKLDMGIDKCVETKLPTPDNIRYKWLNFSDLDDSTCLNYNLRNHYCENSNNVRPFDQIVYNNYTCNGNLNPHKAYGYLMTAEVATALYHFLALHTANVWERVGWVFKRPRV
ncbi:MAG: hypothetical protein GF401_20585 [Chitinivibrionales bacterium]|nr:hypothetical protein [Chitinivibrionales bacterium]